MRWLEIEPGVAYIQIANKLMTIMELLDIKLRAQASGAGAPEISDCQLRALMESPQLPGSYIRLRCGFLSGTLATRAVPAQQFSILEDK
jgi:hypothetical protein